MDGNGKYGGNLGRALDLVFFEQWLRFYFIEERGEELFLSVPDDVCYACRLKYPDLCGLLEALNGRPLDHQATLAALGDIMLSGQFALSGEDWAEILCGADFRITMQLMSYWVQDQEDALDSEVLPFGKWREFFISWREAPAMRDFAARLRGQLHGQSDDEREPDAPAPLQ